MQRTTPPFRADMVGSLLRTRALKEARDILSLHYSRFAEGFDALDLREAKELLDALV